jgi:hypothetical protein
MYLQVNVSANRTGCTLPLSPSSCVNRTEEKIVEKIVYVNRTEEKIVYVEVPGPERIVYTDKIVEKIVNRTEEKIVEKIVYVNSTVEVPKIVYVEVPGPERVVYTDKMVEKIVQVNHTVEKMVEVPKSIFVEKNLTEGTVCTCKPGYYYSTAGARF